MLKELKEGALGAHYSAGLEFARFDYNVDRENEEEMYKALQSYREKNGILNIYLGIILSDIDLDDKGAVLDFLKQRRNNVKSFVDGPSLRHDLNNFEVAKVVLKHYDKLISKLEAAD